jgi:hypothetical protein
MRARCDLSSANMFSRFTRSFQENQPLDSVAAEIVEVERYSSGTENARFAHPLPPLLAYFRHTQPESGGNDNATCRLTDSQSIALFSGQRCRDEFCTQLAH